MIQDDITNSFINNKVSPTVKKLNKVFGILLTINLFLLFLIILEGLVLSLDIYDPKRVYFEFKWPDIKTFHNINSALSDVYKINDYYNNPIHIFIALRYIIGVWILFFIFITLYLLNWVAAVVLSLIILYFRLCERNNIEEVENKYPHTRYIVLQIFFVFLSFIPVTFLIIGYFLLVLNKVREGKNNHSFLIFETKKFTLSKELMVKIFAFTFLFTIFCFLVSAGTYIGFSKKVYFNNMTFAETINMINTMVIFVTFGIVSFFFVSFLTLYYHLQDTWNKNKYKSRWFIALQILLVISFPWILLMLIWYSFLLIVYSAHNKKYKTIINNEEELMEATEDENPKKIIEEVKFNQNIDNKKRNSDALSILFKK
nr:hypothetical protein [Mycoplasma leonicaptivi]